MTEAADAKPLLDVLRRLSREIRDAVLRACREQSLEQLATIAEETREDTIFALDRISEQVLISGLEPHAESLGGLVLIAEGLSERELCLPRSLDASQARWRVIVDPIDGTRGIMYQKRSAWVLAAAAPNLGARTSLSDVLLAVQTEIPTLKGAVSDELWTLRGSKVQAERRELATGVCRPLLLRPSQAESIEQGYAMITRFFPGARDELAAIDEDVVRRVLGVGAAGKALCFEDQYTSSGGQFYELLAGHDRFNADLRPLMQGLLLARGAPLGLCCHPYDVCTALIAEQLGVILTDRAGAALDVPLDLDTEVAWVGYANESIRRQVEPHLLGVLRERGLI